MKSKIVIIMTVLLSLTMLSAQKDEDEIIEKEEIALSPFVDYDAFEELVAEVKVHRKDRLVTLDAFLQKSMEGNTIILDTRSKEMYDLKHVKGAVHLNFSDFTQFTLDSIMNNYAGKNTQILIYCNNNFEDVGRSLMVNKTPVLDMDPAFVTKGVRIPQIQTSISLPTNPLTLALNIPTYINLYGYGYKNVFELGDLVDVKDPRISFSGTSMNEITN